MVIATAISHLVDSGQQRVLLVSNNNVAVDNALHETMRILRTDGDGQAIRVGNIGLPALAADRRVRLDLLVEARQARQRAQVDGLAGQLEELARAGTNLAEAEQQLANFDPGAYQQAAARVDNRHRYDEVTEALGPAEAGLGRARAETRVCEQQLLSLTCCAAEDREAEIQRNLKGVNAALAARQESSLMARSRRPGLKSKLTANRISLENELASAGADRRKAITAARQAGADPVPSVRPDAAQTLAAAERARRILAAAAAECAPRKNARPAHARPGGATSPRRRSA